MATLSLDEFFGTAPAQGQEQNTLPGQSEYDAEKQSNIQQIQAQMVAYRKQGKPNDPRLPILQEQLDQETNALNDQAGKVDILAQRAEYTRAPLKVGASSKVMSLEDFFGSGGGQGSDNADPLFGWSPGDNFQQTLGEVGSRVKDLGKGMLQTGGVLADMILGSPGALWKASVYAGARATGLPGDEAEEYSNRLSPSGILAPVQSTIAALGLGDGTDQQAVSKAMDILSTGIKKGSAWLSNATNGAVPPEDFEEVTNALMGIAGIKGGQAMTAKVIANAEKARQAGIAQQDVRRMPGQPERVEPTMGQQPLEVNIVGGKDGPLPPEPGSYQNGTTGEATWPPEPSATGWKPGEVNIIDSASPEVQAVYHEAVDPTSPEKPIDQIIQYAEDNKHKLSMTGNLPMLGAAAVAAGGWLYMSPEDADKIGVGGLAMAGAIKGKGGMWHPEAVRRLADPLFRNIDEIVFGPDALRNPGWEAEIRRNNPPEIAEQVIKSSEEPRAKLAWADSRIKSYLNKHAGTDTDPLKDVRVPMMGEDVRWEDLTDQIIHNQEPNLGDVAKRQLGVRPGEALWNITPDWSTGTMQETRAITSYLSHVGDYLREFKDVTPQSPGQWLISRGPEALQNRIARLAGQGEEAQIEAVRNSPEYQRYLKVFDNNPLGELRNVDLIRAVQETSAQDVRQAAKMAKARVNQAGTVTFKEYPDGMKWVEVGKVPDELPKGYKIEPDTSNHGQGFQVRKPDGSLLFNDETMRVPTLYTEAEAIEFARKSVANDALRNEGDIMGHCVGGYCEYVHSGESKIYSLRDKQGMSHVTVEVEPEGAQVRTPYGNNPTGEIVREPNIVQIKGKQNRAPMDKYLPYVQDFVKGGKWGEVGDLQNTGLIKNPEHPQGNLGEYTTPAEFVKSRVWENYGPTRLDNYNTDSLGLVDRGDLKQDARDALAEKYGKRNYYSNEELDSVIGNDGKILPQGQRGSIDPKLLTGLAVAGAGAYIGAGLDKDNKLVGAALGTLGGLALRSGLARRSASYKAIENGIKVSIDQFVRKLNPDAMGPRAEQSAAILASHYTEQLQKQVFQGKEGAVRQRYFEHLPEKDQVAFVKALEAPGVKYKDPKLQAMRDAYKEWSNRVYEQDKANDIKYEPLDNYVYHIFADPDGAAAFFQQKYGNKWGDPKFTKERSAKMISDAEASGFKLKYTNPEQIAQARQLASDVAQMKVAALRDLADNGLARKVEKGMKATSSETLWRSPNGELYFLTDEANQVFHNAFNSKSLWNDAGLLGMAYRGSMWTKNAILPVKLMSAFHALHIALGMNLGTTAVNAIKSVAAGKVGFLRAGMDVTKSAMLIDSGKQLAYVSRKMQPHSMQAFRGDIPTSKITELDKQQMQNAYEGGFSPEMSEEYRNQSIKDFRNAVAAHSARALWHAPFALMEAAWTRPMFQNWIPAVKWEAFQKTAAAHLAANPDLAGDALARRVALRKVSKMIDDRFGEVQYKTLFMDRMVKDVAVASFLSYGWQLGFVRSYLGAFPEAARAFTKNEGPGSGTLRQKIAQGKLDKTLFLGSYLTGTMLYGGLLTYALTDTLPQSILDYIYPRSGDKNKDGTDARVSTPFYTREFVQIPSHVQKEGVVGGLATTVGGKLSPVFSLLKGIVMNKDYFDRAIANPNDDLVTTAQKKGKWLMGELEPMAMNRPKNAPDTTKSKLLGVAGFNPAPRYVTHPQGNREYIRVPKRNNYVSR